MHSYYALTYVCFGSCMCRAQVTPVSKPDLCLRVVRLDWGGGGGWVGPWPVGGWVSLVLGNLAQGAYSPPGGGVGSGWVGRGWVGPDSPKLTG